MDNGAALGPLLALGLVAGDRRAEATPEAEAEGAADAEAEGAAL